jgi:hypothetical protein
MTATPDERARYRELAVFGQDVELPGDGVGRIGPVKTGDCRGTPGPAAPFPGRRS